jgi:dienelactone hydrolase
MRVVLFHSTQGLRRAERDLASALCRDGHEVVVPDLFAGRTAETVEDGLALKDAVGWPRIRERARQSVRDLPGDTVLAGVSMGAGVVSELWPDRPATPAVVLIHGYAVIPDHVPAGVRAILHVAVGDPFAPDDVVSDWQATAAARGIEAEVDRYPGVGHFFTDPDSPDYDEAAAEAVAQRVRRFLRQAGGNR